MKHHYYSLTFQRNLNKFLKCYRRLDKKIKKGSFKKLNARKRAFLISRIEELMRKLETVKPGFVAMVAGTSLAFTLSANNASAQTFVRDSTANPLKTVTYPYSATPPENLSWIKPTFADLDADGDADCIIGCFNGYNDYHTHALVYYKNTGTASAPVFTAQSTSATDPFYSIPDTAGFPTPALADLDGDGDLDMFIGEGSSSYLTNNSIHYYKNIGSKTNPNFQLQSANSLFGPTTTSAPANVYNPTPAFVDID